MSHPHKFSNVINLEQTTKVRLDIMKRANKLSNQAASINPVEQDGRLAPLRLR
jgi:hypothetical protein